MRPQGQTDRHNEDNSHSVQFCERAKKRAKYIGKRIQQQLR